MRHATILLAAGLALAGGATALSLNAETAPSDPAPVEADDPDASVDAEVTVRNFEFSDADTGTPVTHVEPGDTVRWTWEGGAHSVTQGVRGLGNEPVGPSDSGIPSTSDDEDGGGTEERFVAGLDVPIDVTFGPDGAMYVLEFYDGDLWWLSPPADTGSLG